MSIDESDRYDSTTNESLNSIHCGTKRNTECSFPSVFGIVVNFNIGQ